MKGAIFSFAIIRPLISPIKAVIVKAVKMGTRMGNSGRFGKSDANLVVAGSSMRQ